MQTHSWALFRRLRTACFSAAGRNPLGFSASYVEELRAIQTIQRAMTSPPRKLRDDGELTLWSTLLGDFWTPRRADAHFLGMLVVETLLDVYRYSASGGEVVFDCGGNIGMFSRRVVQEHPALVVAFEPCAENIPAFRRNLADEIASGLIRFYEAGVWDKKTQLYLKHSPTANPGSPSVTEAPDPHTSLIELTTIDQIASDLNLARLDFIKMDIEGAEVNAISGARDVIKRFRPRIAVGTEHTEDIYSNNVKVVETVLGIDPRYEYVITEVHADRSTNGRWMLVPHSLVFEPK